MKCPYCKEQIKDSDSVYVYTLTDEDKDILKVFLRKKFILHIGCILPWFTDLLKKRKEHHNA